VGLIYGLVGVRCPAPPTIVLLGLPGILGGEQVATVLRHSRARGLRVTAHV
jgi:XapX domain-containing protein